MNTQTATNIYNALNSAKNPLLICHEKPDGDTLGASLAMAHYLDKIHKPRQHFCADKPATYFSYLPKIENIITDLKLLKLEEHDLIITIDCGAIERTGIHGELSKYKFTLINIDHHQTNNNFGHHNLVIPSASSTCEIIYKFFRINNIAMDKYTATSLLTGIITDTMNFTNAGTTQDSLKIAADLLSQGARINQIIASISQNKDIEALKLWGKVLYRLQINPENNFAYTVITKKDLEEFNIDNTENLDGLANFLSIIQDVDYIMVLTEDKDNMIKGSLRTTKDNIDVAQIAQRFGGGGHKKAAGFKIPGQLEHTDEGWKIV